MASLNPQTTGAVARCLAYLETLPPAIAGSGGHAATLRAAQAIMRFDGLSEADRGDCLRWFNQHKCRPVWTGPELAHKLEDAARLTAQNGRAGMFKQATRPQGQRRGKAFVMGAIPTFTPVLPLATLPAQPAPTVARVPEPDHTEPDLPQVPQVTIGAVMTWNDLADFRQAGGVLPDGATLAPVWVPGGIS